MYCVNCGKENDEKSQFCMHCGEALHVPGEGIASTQQPLATQGVTEKPVDNKKNRQRLMIGLGIGGLVLVIATCAAIVLSSLGYNLFSPKEQLIYMIQEDQNDNFATAVMIIRADGKENEEFYSDRDGFLPFFLSGSKNNIISPDGLYLVLLDREGELLLINKRGAAPIPLDTGDINGISFFQLDISPDGMYVGYTARFDDSRPSVCVVDLQGNEVITIDDVAFSTFLPNSRQVVVSEFDADDNMAALAIIDVHSGEYTHLVDFEGEGNYHMVLLSPDGKTIYYTDDTGLMAISATGGIASSVYESEKINSAFFSSDGRMIAILDGEKAALYLYETKRESTIRIDKGIFIGSIFGIPISLSFSPDSKYLAYIVGEGYGDLELYFIKADGSDRVQVATNAEWYGYAFSPDKSHIAYIKGSDGHKGGGLYIMLLDGSESKRLDTGVWSFRFVNGGKYIVYTKVTDLERGSPESEIYRIRIDGQKRESILDIDDGLYTFISPLP